MCRFRELLTACLRWSDISCGNRSQFFRLYCPLITAAAVVLVRDLHFLLYVLTQYTFTTSLHYLTFPAIRDSPASLLHVLRKLKKFELPSGFSFGLVSANITPRCLIEYKTHWCYIQLQHLGVVIREYGQSPEMGSDGYVRNCAVKKFNKDDQLVPGEASNNTLTYCIVMGTHSRGTHLMRENTLLISILAMESRRGHRVCVIACGYL